MYTTSPPILSDSEGSIELRYHGEVQSDERNDLTRMIISFTVNRTNNNDQSRKVCNY